jgi:hypothetical protein
MVGYIEKYINGRQGKTDWEHEEGQVTILNIVFREASLKRRHLNKTLKQ